MLNCSGYYIEGAKLGILLGAFIATYVWKEGFRHGINRGVKRLVAMFKKGGTDYDDEEDNDAEEAETAEDKFDRDANKFEREHPGAAVWRG